MGFKVKKIAIMVADTVTVATTVVDKVADKIADTFADTFEDSVTATVSANIGATVTVADSDADLEIFRPENAGDQQQRQQSARVLECYQPSIEPQQPSFQYSFSNPKISFKYSTPSQHRVVLVSLLQLLPGM